MISKSSLIAAALAATVTSAHALADFTPESPVAGKTVAPEGARASFTVPNGWDHRWQKNESGDDVYLLVPRQYSERAAVIMSRAPLTGEYLQMSMEQRLAAGLVELIGGDYATPVVGPESFEVGGNEGGRLIAQATLPNGKTVEVYLGAMVANRQAYIIFALYEANLAGTMRPSVDTVLASLRAVTPKPNTQLARRLVGCWEFYESNSSGSGYGSSQDTLCLSADGSFRQQGYTSVSAGGMNSMDRHDDAGVFAVYGNELELTTNQGEVKTYTVRFDGRILYLGNAKYLPRG